MSKTSTEHKAEAPSQLGFAVITVSTSRYQRLRKGEKVEDASGDLIVKLLKNAGHFIILRKVVSDDRVLLLKALQEALQTKGVKVVITCGGTGVSPSDVTIETVRPALDKILPGFGEFLRRMSYEQIGSPAMLTRAMAGTIKGRAVFCIPGSPQAVATAVEKLILPEVGHIIKHAATN